MSGSPCIGCGYCCSTVICRTGAMIYGHYSSPCPALEWNGSRYVCSLFLSDPDRYEHFLDIGGGCCFPENPRKTQAEDEDFSATEYLPRSKCLE